MKIEVRKIKKCGSNICFGCKNAVPDSRGHGCSWSERFEPVPGWTAVPVILNPGRIYDQTETYHITACPEFDPDDERPNDGFTPIPVRCVETGEVFGSLRKAAEAKKVDVGSIGYAIRQGYGYSGGFHWEKVEK